ncbi:MAG: amino acid synthesis family protein [Acidobacteria bacterium]|nr:amino acid synthesis family protein [Acidobacteriota bacterium]
MGVVHIRKILLVIEDTLTESGKEVTPPLRKAAALAVIANPYAGRYIEDLSLLIEAGGELGELLGTRAVEALGANPVQSYGKAAIVGFAGELEHCAAILHPKLGKPFRAAVGGGEAIIPSSIKRGGPGTSIDVPLHFKDDVWRFANFDAIEVRVPDAPGPEEIVVAVAVTNLGRPHPRVGDRRVL